MRIPRIHAPQTLSRGAEIRLPAETAHRLQRVLRLPPGAALAVFDGSGGEWGAVLQSVDRQGATVRLNDFHPETRESPLHTQLGLALARGKRTDWALQKAVELGLTVFQPLFGERCEVRDGGPRWRENRMRHWRQVVVHAAEQSGRTVLTEVRAPALLRDWLATVDTPHRLALHPGSARTLGDLGPANAVSLLAGPEGGFSEEELEASCKAGFEPLSLGPRTLRSETAPAAALALLQHYWGDGGGA